jgi:hypothetical protein
VLPDPTLCTNADANAASNHHHHHHPAPNQASQQALQQLLSAAPAGSDFEDMLNGHCETVAVVLSEHVLAVLDQGVPAAEVPPLPFACFGAMSLADAVGLRTRWQ